MKGDISHNGVGKEASRLLLSFANFRVIPGEVVPFYAARRFYTRELFVVAVLVAVIILVKCAFVVLTNPIALSDFAINGIELVVAVLVMASPRLSRESELRMLNGIIVFSFCWVILVELVPAVEAIKFILMDRDVTTDVLRAHERGHSFLSSEPSYAGVFFVGLLMLALQLRASLVCVGAYIFLIFLTSSIWAFALGFFAVMAARNIMVVIVGGVLAGILLFITPVFTESLLGLASPRVAGVYRLVFVENTFASLAAVEEHFGSLRLSTNAFAFTEFLSFESNSYLSSYSFFSQMVAVNGTIIGCLLSGLVIARLVCLNGLSSLRYVWILFVFGPVVLPTNYLVLRRMI